jgi:hypothetical protein
VPTEKQIQANILNAQSSTGPKTEEGKNASKANALQHGLAAGELVPVGAREHFEEIYDDLCDVFGNDNAAKRILIQKMANAVIRERDCEDVEFFLLEYAAAEDAGQPLTVPEPGTNQATAYSFYKRMSLEKALNLVHRYKTAAQREFSRNHADAMRAVAYTYRVHAEQAKRRNAAARQALTGPLPDLGDFASYLERRAKPKAPKSTTEINR